MRQKRNKANSHLTFNQRKQLLKVKRSQAQVITTVLLILIAIAAIAIVSGVVINFVRNRLVFTECFDTTGQLEIDADSEFTFYESNTSDSPSFLRVQYMMLPNKITEVALIYPQKFSCPAFHPISLI